MGRRREGGGRREEGGGKVINTAPLQTNCWRALDLLIAGAESGITHYNVLQSYNS